MKVKTSELQGAALDWVVAKCEGMSRLDERTTPDGVRWAGDFFQPTKNWQEGGPIIEREKIDIKHFQSCVMAQSGKGGKFTESHETQSLIAAMRCYVSSKLGEEVEVPDELLTP